AAIVLTHVVQPCYEEVVAVCVAVHPVSAAVPAPDVFLLCVFRIEVAWPHGFIAYPQLPCSRSGLCCGEAILTDQQHLAKAVPATAAWWYLVEWNEAMGEAGQCFRHAIRRQAAHPRSLAQCHSQLYGHTLAHVQA